MISVDTLPLSLVIRRLVRLLMCFDPALINQHLLLLDAYILYEVDLFSELLASYEDSANRTCHPSRAPVTVEARGLMCLLVLCVHQPLTPPKGPWTSSPASPRLLPLLGPALLGTLPTQAS